MIMSVSTFIMGRGAATPVSSVNFCITLDPLAPPRCSAGTGRSSRWAIAQGSPAGWPGEHRREHAIAEHKMMEERRRCVDAGDVDDEAAKSPVQVGESDAKIPGYTGDRPDRTDAEHRHRVALK